MRGVMPLFDMTHEELVNEVFAKLNEIGYNENVSLITDDNTKLTDYVEVAIRDAVMQIDRCNPKRITFKAGGDDGMNVPISDSGMLTLDLNFVSLLEVNAKEWNRAVSVITEKGTPEYVMAMNEYTKPKANSPMVLRDGVRSVRLLPVPSEGSMVFNAAYDGNGIMGESESRLVVDLAAQIVYKIFDGGR